MARRFTMFSWGYHGWGNATRQLVKAVDAVEASRGFAPPLFVDIRIQRSVRAKGFNDRAFEKLVGPSRYRWMKSLGNKRIESGEGRFIQVAEPQAVGELLEIGAEAAEKGRRVIYFCHCRSPLSEGKVARHRRAVSTLLGGKARREGTRLEVVEWPGSRPGHVHVDVEAGMLAKLKKGRTSLSIGRRVELAEMAGLGIGSIATIHCGDEAIHRLVGPAEWKAGGWSLPVLWYFFDDETPLSTYRREAVRLRKLLGMEPIVV